MSTPNQQSKLNVGVLTAAVSRRAGGLYWSVRALTRGTKSFDCNVSVFSVTDQFSDEDAANWQDLNLHLSQPLGPQAFGYGRGWSKAVMEADLDVVHSHGLWMYNSVIASRWSQRGRRPTVISPRGMLDPWAAKNASTKKKVASLFFEGANMRNASCFHALADSEYQSIRQYGLNNSVAIIPNGMDLPDLSLTVSKPVWDDEVPQEKKVLLFVGRIHPKKGLSAFLQGLKELQRRQASLIDDWMVVIAGWNQGDHLSELERAVDELGLSNFVRFVGPQFDDEKVASLRRADAFFLTSFSEGLPMAVLEAWSFQLPVLMTPFCNLPEGFEADAAIEVQPESSSISAGLGTLFEMSDAQREAMGHCGRTLVDEKFSWRDAGKKMADVYRWTVSGGTPPDCVRLK
ncbi:D-inositol 3-phosphate glycosyltransferase [Rubripirellula amarantea]|uniref:D-inositol 3-phosphate glycosyltransferase n=1 Tax=Rubripirellula amarantea TaxID=2527999 RepID=A0A5C5WPQ7_9BACT|nr:glycosyltransferase [Rubripirellula amarantea]TWT52648.1 D-inositol 3-phosphate glycosyltransferase [Rubripirellula amarantea]